MPRETQGTDSKDGGALTEKIIHLERPHHTVQKRARGSLTGHTPGLCWALVGAWVGEPAAERIRWHCGVERSGGHPLVIQKSPSRLQGPDKYLFLLGGGGAHRGGPAPPEGSQKASGGGVLQWSSCREEERRGDGADQQE